MTDGSHLKVLPISRLFSFLNMTKITFKSKDFINCNTTQKKNEGEKAAPEIQLSEESHYSCLRLLDLVCLLRTNVDACRSHHRKKRKTKSQVGAQVNSYRSRKFNRALSLKIWKWNIKFPVGNTHDNEKTLENHMKSEILMVFLKIYISGGTQNLRGE